MAEDGAAGQQEPVSAGGLMHVASNGGSWQLRPRTVLVVQEG